MSKTKWDETVVIKRINTIMERRSRKMRRMKFLSLNKPKIIRNNIWRRRWVLITNNKINSMNLFNLNTTTKRKKLIKRMNKYQISKLIMVKMRKDCKTLMTLWNIRITRRTMKNKKNKNKMMMRVKIEYQKPIGLFIFFNLIERNNILNQGKFNTIREDPREYEQ
jgi:hypothetical protein